MSMPPETVPASTLWDRLSKSERPRRIVPFPRNGEDGGEMGTVAIVVLRQAEIMSCMAAAEGYAREMLKAQKSPDNSHGYQDLYNEAKVCELLWKACKATDDPAMPNLPAFGISSQGLRQMLTSDEVAVLFRAYCDWQVESGPILADMTEEEMDAWIDKLKEAGSRLPLPAHSLEARTDLLMRSIARLRKSETVSISSGAQPESSSQSPSPPTVSDDEVVEAPSPVET